MKEMNFISKLGPYIEAMIEEKLALGFSENSYNWEYEAFDKYVAESEYNDGTLSEEIANSWLTSGSGNTSRKLPAIRNIAKYLRSIGFDAYLPPTGKSEKHSCPYVPTREELIVLFCVIDETLIESKVYSHLNYVYPVIFRLYYCLGLRLNEAVMLERSDIDFVTGTIYIRHSKGDKDRIIYVSDDLCSLMLRYDAKMDEIIPDRTWFFPGGIITNHFSKTTICNKIQLFWDRAFPEWKGRKPTVHSLRHAFVVHRINDWVEDGGKAEDLLPYISKHLGHSSISDTMYYYHMKDTETGALHQFISTSDILVKEVLEW